MYEGRYVAVVMPAYNAAKTLELTYQDIPKEIVDKIILVDDSSADETTRIAAQLGIATIAHITNRGYGGNQKTCYIEALESGADIIVMVHPDNQYDPKVIPELVRPIAEGRADFVLGSRFLRGDPRLGGMPTYKFLANRFLTLVENAAFSLHLSECHTGYRAYSRRFLETIPFLLNSDNFVFDTQVIAQAAAFRFSVTEVPVPTRYFAEASTVKLKAGVLYGLSTLGVVARFLFHRWRVIKAEELSKHLPDLLSAHHRNAIARARRTLD